MSMTPEEEIAELRKKIHQLEIQIMRLESIPRPQIQVVGQFGKKGEFIPVVIV